MSEALDFSHLSMVDLLCMEVKTQATTLNDALLALETTADAAEALATLMRAAHSVKGAARIVQVEAAVAIAHGLEDCFVAAQVGSLSLTAQHIDTLLQSTDLLLHIVEGLAVPPISPCP